MSVEDSDVACVSAVLLTSVPGIEAKIIELLPPQLYTTAIPMAYRIMNWRTDRGGQVADPSATIRALASAATWDDATLADVILDAGDLGFTSSLLAQSVRSVPPMLLGRLAASPSDPPLTGASLRLFLEHGALPDARVPGVAVTYLSRLLKHYNGTSWDAVAALIEYGARLDMLVIDHQQVRPLWQSSMRDTGAQRRLVILARTCNAQYPVTLRTFGCAAGPRCHAPARRFLMRDGDGAVMHRAAGFLGPLIPNELSAAMQAWAKEDAAVEAARMAHMMAHAAARVAAAHMARVAARERVANNDEAEMDEFVIPGGALDP